MAINQPGSCLPGAQTLTMQLSTIFAALILARATAARPPVASTPCNFPSNAPATPTTKSIPDSAAPTTDESVPNSALPLSTGAAGCLGRDVNCADVFGEGYECCPDTFCSVYFIGFGRCQYYE
ncbi:hypothetical protein B0H17DRAFT_1202293 [Mycena rosella]|uniref:Hydrophobin n=1 Tax=Mycena rosella TaxID=1033263 RepID=A0AAD7DE58_MYCRO|nr:hypothetical protein B0H17DRAFT_1202293 [Mycena rosella]